MNANRVTCAAALMVVALTCAMALSAFAAGSADEGQISLKRGTQWMSLQVGYAKGNGDVSPDGLVGGGFGFRRFVLDQWSVGGFVHYDLLGKFNGAADIMVPITIEIARHGRWGAAVSPYVGFGGGAYYHKYYRSGQDVSNFTPGRYLTVGATTPVHKGGLLGLAVRMASVVKPDDNPMFPGPDPDRTTVDDLLTHLKGLNSADGPWLRSDEDSKTRLLWSVKLDYTLTY